MLLHLCNYSPLSAEPFASHSTLLDQNIPYSLRTALYVYFLLLNMVIRTQNFSLLSLESSITAQCYALDVLLHLAALLKGVFHNLQ